MAKSFKKAIACLLAVLMVAFSLPFSALAAAKEPGTKVGEYEPDIQLQFSPFYDATAGYYNVKTATTATCVNDTVLKDAAITYDEAAGTLTLKKEDINAVDSYWDLGNPVDEDLQYQTGDVFALTVRMDNIDYAWGANVYIRFSDNLTPAGLYSVTKTGRGGFTKYGIGTEEEMLAAQSEQGCDTSKKELGFEVPLVDFSASGLYEGMNDSVFGDFSAIEEDKFYEEGSGMSKQQISASYVMGGETTDVGHLHRDDFYDIENHELTDQGYTYLHQAIMATFVFEITGDPTGIKFELADPYAENYGVLNGAYLIAKMSDGTTGADKTTYAVNRYDVNKKDNTGDTINPGSTKMSFMGKNVNWKTEETKYNITFKDKDGQVMQEYSKEYDEGAAVTIPDLPVKAYDSDYHYSYAWDKTPSPTAVAEAVYQVVETKTPHSYTDQVTQEATCVSPGKTLYTCKVNGEEHSYTDETKPEATGQHTPGEVKQENVKPATKTEKGSYEEVTYCDVCKQPYKRETKEIDKIKVNVQVTKTDLGYVTGLETGDNMLEFGQEYTVTAVDSAGTFKYWELNGNIVSEDRTYTSVAYSDVVLTPIFADDTTAANITVTFYDKYGNTVKQYKDMSKEDYQAAIAKDYDSLVGPSYPSYKFVEWEKSKEELLALEHSTTVWGVYEEEKTGQYTVTTDAELDLPAGIENGQIPYDTLVTVSDERAKSWKIGETTVAYGTSYSFYVGSDIEVQPVYEEAEAVASTTIIGANLVNGSDYKYNIVATRNIPEGYELVDYGFVYGKNLTDEELDLDKVGDTAASGATVKAAHAGARNATTNEFALNYGITTKSAPVTAKSFVIVRKDGTTQIIYSDRFEKAYN